MSFSYTATGSFDPAALDPAFDPAKAFEICSTGLKTFLDDNFGKGPHDVVIGLSGGMDSALVAAIATATLGAEHVHGVTLPGPHTTPGTLDDAYNLAETLGIDIQTIEIEDPYDACVDAINWGAGVDVEDTIAGQNIQARLRMIMLMALSNAKGWTVLNTGNCSEACMGYCTLYGDTVGAYDPIGGLLKTEVFALGQWMNRDGEVIPASIIERAPSAELAEGQTDEDSLGVTYATLDKVLAQLLAGKTEAEIVASGAATAEAVAAIVRRKKANAFKGAWLPPHPAVLHG